MKSTYLNDTLSSVYPFASFVVPTFPLACIRGCGVYLLRYNGVATNPKVSITSLEISALGLVATVAVDDVHALTISCQNGRSEVLTGGNGTWPYAGGWILPGTLDPQYYGTYHGDFVLDASCVTMLSYANHGNISRFVANGTQHMEAGQLVNIAFTGLLDCDADFNIVADIPDGTVLTVQDTVRDYDMVRCINNIDVPKRDDYSSTLKIIIGSPTDQDRPSPLKATVENIQRVSDIILDPYADNPDELPDAESGPRDQFWINLYDNRSNAVILSICGTQELPSCYAQDEDDAKDDWKETEIQEEFVNDAQ